MSSWPLPSFGALLKRHRHVAGLTQEALAERALISADTISTLERGVNARPRSDTRSAGDVDPRLPRRYG